MTLQAESPTEPLARETPRNEWVAVCTKRQLIPERGVAVLVKDQQVALFRVTGTDPRTGEPADFVYAVGHRDPFADANVIARGIVGSVGQGDAQRDTVASPMYKHVFDLATGECLTDPNGRLPVYRTWIAGGVVYVHPVPVTPALVA
ncbi:nitrite reductase (NAD(P)H) small subunit [Nocardioides pocheonensis]|uniref:Nitrite reductase (NAD(P)H) small subunit n=1 Tax=Nocardioides pocheonensis TaxID=661485 RepID=A0A3N0GGE5_9ACTN|nr:nitrite reductase (NAD(P)H) small subunit [Nocardioides pocheonensis]RNM11509.1 nitrite reductase (NAD(P)H) small subunit [Nocardioides pocheonensis]